MNKWIEVVFQERATADLEAFLGWLGEAYNEAAHRD